MLNVFLGYSCNLKCSYCLQAPLQERERKVRPNADAFIEQVVPWVIEKNIKKIAYWGGEPLVYWNVIEQIQEEFIKRGHEFEMIKIATNGTLFTDKHVEQCNKWGAYVIVSQHKAFGTPAWEQIMKLERSSLSFLFHHDELYAWDWIMECRELEQKYGRYVHPFMHWNRSTSGADPLTDITQNDLDKHIVHLWDLAKLAVEGDRHCKDFWKAHLIEWRHKIDGEAVPMCYGDHQIDIDLDGNRYGCHHTVEPWLKSGNIFEDSHDPKVIKQVRKFIDTEECSTCELASWCRGDCHLSRNHDVDCRLSKYKHKILTWLDKRLEDDNERVYKHD